VPRNGTTTVRIGIDFDNTLANYDHVFLAAAKRCGLIAPTFAGSKRAVRDSIRRLPDGELAWQRLQGYAYGAGIGGATLFDGAAAFLRKCRAEGFEVFVISHKTQFSHHDPTRVDFHRAALDWMADQGFFHADAFDIPVERIFFESTRAAKLELIGALGCTHFIDDLEEVFADPGFPERVRKVLFAPSGALRIAAVCPTWQRIGEVVLDGWR